jgi:succinyl-CoA synthetase (ADP-forming) alpha subunit (EC 6.2.1.5)
MSILINKNTRVVTQGITGKTGQFHTKMSKEYANGADCYVAGVNPKKAGESYEGIPIFASVKEAKKQTGVNTSVIYVPPPSPPPPSGRRSRLNWTWSFASPRVSR